MSLLSLSLHHLIANILKTQTQKTMEKPLSILTNDGEVPLDVTCMIDWNGSASNSDAYLKSVNGLPAYFIEASSKARIERIVLKQHEANLTIVIENTNCCVHCGSPAEHSSFCSIYCFNEQKGIEI